MANEKLTIKSVGFIDEEWKLELSNGSTIENVSRIEIDKERGNFGLLKIEILLDKSAKFEFLKNE